MVAIPLIPPDDNLLGNKRLSENNSESKKYIS